MGTTTTTLYGYIDEHQYRILAYAKSWDELEQIVERNPDLMDLDGYMRVKCGEFEPDLAKAVLAGKNPTVIGDDPYEIGRVTHIVFDTDYSRMINTI